MALEKRGCSHLNGEALRILARRNTAVLRYMKRFFTGAWKES